MTHPVNPRTKQMQRLIALVNDTNPKDIPELMRAMFDMYFMSMVRVAEDVGEGWKVESLAVRVANLMMDVQKRVRAKHAETN